ncbi:uncharacterized protein B0P05DRAFT_75330 [Gilbertella persicaria]|uniref:uncharacterized protein n=1 Tax=Gilbertella persicaria TaxID=101096 RepID=UPI00221EC5B1|nr:uncharacterized protein B0P05DRAFT_75330 [Gilbertella persicaria]KAI8080848.1 hypothetical protein B0P05DRAFT_75330 [Gilbertella persicaria]
MRQNDRVCDGLIHVLVCSTFGRFSREFLAETYTKINNHKQESKPAPSNPNAKPVRSDAVKNEVLMLGNNLPGGLITPNKNKSSKPDQERPIFKVPALPNKSLLGLDELARKKRQADAATAATSTSSTEKKVRLSWDEEEEEEQQQYQSKSDSHERITRHRPSYRSQRMETPSNPGGVSDVALKRLEDMKRRDRHRGRTHHDDKSRKEEPKPSIQQKPETPRRGGLIKRSQWSSMTPSNQGAFTPRTSIGNMTPGRHDSGYRMSTGAATAAVRRTWDHMTPAVQSTAYDEVALEYPEEFQGDEEDRRKWEEEQAQLDREWYQMEDYGAADDTHNAFAQYETHDKHKEEELTQKQLKKLSARQAQYNRDTDMWEASRMLSSGVAQRIEVDTDFDEENEVRMKKKVKMHV